MRNDTSILQKGSFYFRMKTVKKLSANTNQDRCDFTSSICLVDNHPDNLRLSYPFHIQDLHSCKWKHQQLFCGNRCLEECWSILSYGFWQAREVLMVSASAICSSFASYFSAIKKIGFKLSYTALKRVWKAKISKSNLMSYRSKMAFGT